MKRLSLRVVGMVLPIFFLTSCYDARELDEWSYVYTIGVDRGVDDAFRLTMQLPTFKQSAGGQSSSSSSQSGQSGGGSQSGGNFSVISVDCPSLYTGLNLVNASLSRRINMMHCKYILISDELASDNIGYVCDAIVRDRQIRRITHLIIVKGSAKKFVESFNPVVGTAIAKTQEGQMHQVMLTGLSSHSSVGEFLNALKTTTAAPTATYAAINDSDTFRMKSSGSGSSSGNGSSSGVGAGQTGGSSSGEGMSPQIHTFMPYVAGTVPRSGGNKTEYLGTALFDGGKMIGILDGGESQTLQMMKGDFAYASFALQDPIESKLTDTLQVRQESKPRISVRFEEGKPVIRLELFLAGSVQQVQSLKGKDDTELLPKLQKEFRTELQAQIEKTFENCRNLNCDAFDFGGTAVRQFTTIQQWQEFNWLGRFRDASLSTRIEFTIRRDGTMLKNNTLFSTSGAAGSSSAISSGSGGGR